MIKLRLDTSGRPVEETCVIMPSGRRPRRVKVFGVQGFGRFSPFGPAKSNSEIRYDLSQDWGAVFWWPLVLFGVVQSIRLGRDQLRSGVPPTAIALLIWAAVAWVVVAVYLPMAWDRYMLPIQAPNALLAAVGVSGLWDRLKEPIGGGLEADLRPGALGVSSSCWGAMPSSGTPATGTPPAGSCSPTRWSTAARSRSPGWTSRPKTRPSSRVGSTPTSSPAIPSWRRCRMPTPDGLSTSRIIRSTRPRSSTGASDYWITLGTSGVLTAWTAALLVILARDLGCSPWPAALIGLSYGLSTPAYVYATLAYGHQASAFALLSSFLLLWRKEPRREALRIFLAGFLAAYASVIELQMAPVSAILACYLMAQWVQGIRRFDRLWIFALGALLPTLLLLGYNQAAFHTPWDLGYLHHATKEFADVHNRDNPLGLMSPDWSKLGPLLWSRYRGLFVFAPDLAPGRAGMGRIDGDGADGAWRLYRCSWLPRSSW